MPDGRIQNGGARPGAGRKPLRQKYEGPINVTEEAIVDRLSEFIRNQFSLALGGGQRSEEKWALAGTVSVEDFQVDDNGKIVKVKRPAFPGRDPEEMVLVERKVVTLPADHLANEYLIDRILGKPTQSVESTVTVLKQLAEEIEGLSDDELLALAGGDGSEAASQG